tara:strand:+ start:886 stop:1089 length:204 start_codon:yes stop_codon:yes gene_type:complete
MFASAYDDWKLASPPEAEEEDVYVSCNMKDDYGPCSFEGKVTARCDTHRFYWSCPRCDWDHEEEWAE